MCEKVLVDLVVTKIEDIFDGSAHFFDIKGLEGFLFDAFDIKLVINFFFDVLTIGLQIDEQSFFGLLNLLHKSFNKIIRSTIL